MIWQLLNETALAVFNQFLANSFSALVLIRQFQLKPTRRAASRHNRMISSSSSSQISSQWSNSRSSVWHFITQTFIFRASNQAQKQRRALALSIEHQARSQKRNHCLQKLPKPNHKDQVSKKNLSSALQTPSLLQAVRRNLRKWSLPRKRTKMMIHHEHSSMSLKWIAYQIIIMKYLAENSLIYPQILNNQTCLNKIVPCNLKNRAR